MIPAEFIIDITVQHYRGRSELRLIKHFSILILDMHILSHCALLSRRATGADQLLLHGQRRSAPPPLEEWPWLSLFISAFDAPVLLIRMGLLLRPWQVMRGSAFFAAAVNVAA